MAEGEKDANAGARLPGVAAATSHWGGAAVGMTPEQAQHLAPLATAASRRSGRRVVIVVDRDDPGYANGLHTWELLRVVGFRRSQLAVVRPADGVISGGAVCTGVCDCEPVCPPPGRGWEKADLTDHVRAGYGLRDLVPVSEADLRVAADRWAQERAAGAEYGAPVPSEFTPEFEAELRALAAEWPGWPARRKKAA
ncbi:toprim domain-containing protein [Pseudonocardia cypriaca]|uniref:toprim domain-containing protein n=1 Tax=Pseudonocardia cypriaca TaxID=882449 RepID=UPI0011512974|nr:toprim domain-containing protein [Pseudonocardia cypriaca]